MTGVPGMRIDAEGDRKRWLGRTIDELARHRRAQRQACRAWLVARGMHLEDGVIRLKADFAEERAEIEARRVDRTPCWRCGVRGDVGCEHQRWTA